MWKTEFAAPTKAAAKTNVLQIAGATPAAQDYLCSLIDALPDPIPGQLITIKAHHRTASVAKGVTQPQVQRSYTKEPLDVTDETENAATSTFRVAIVDHVADPEHERRMARAAAHSRPTHDPSDPIQTDATYPKPLKTPTPPAGSMAADKVE